MQGKIPPIQGASKAKRIAWSTPPNQISWAHMKLIREGNRTMRVYQVNPYVEVYQYYESLYGLLLQSCDGAPDLWSWLIVGPKKAMLIDTGFGLGDTKALVDEITGGLPLVVVNTQGSPDHVLGNCRFERVYCHEYDYERIKGMGKPGAWDYLFDKAGKNLWLEFDRKDLPAAKSYDLVAVRDGAMFNLGGDYDIELVWTAGHTPGHAMFLDRKQRRLFTGDDLNSDVMALGVGAPASQPNAQYANLATYKDCLTRLMGRIGEYDYLFPSHYMVNIENFVLTTQLETVSAILARPEVFNYTASESNGGDGAKQERMHKYVRGFSTIAYTKDGIYPAKR